MEVVESQVGAVEIWEDSQAISAPYTALDAPRHNSTKGFLSLVTLAQTSTNILRSFERSGHPSQDESLAQSLASTIDANGAQPEQQQAWTYW